MEEISNEIKKNPKDFRTDIVVPKDMNDIQRYKIEKLMKRDPSKPVFIPEPPKEWKPKDAPEFVRDVMGSSAGAGSGEFHVYRHIRQREKNRQKYLHYKDITGKMDKEYQEIRDNNLKKAEEATAKRREKRLKKKRKLIEKKEQEKKAKLIQMEDKEKNIKEDIEQQIESKKQVDDDNAEKEDDAEEQSFVMGGK